MVLGHNALGNGQPQAEAAIPAPGRISAVKALEDLAAGLRRDRFPLVGHRQRTVIPPPPVESYLGLAAGAGVLLGVVQQNLQHPPQRFLIAADGDPLVHLGDQGEALLKEQRLKGQEAPGGQTAEIHRPEHKVGFGAVRAGQLQHLLDEGAHLPGHGQDVGQKAGLAGCVLASVL